MTVDDAAHDCPVMYTGWRQNEVVGYTVGEKRDHYTLDF